MLKDNQANALSQNKTKDINFKNDLKLFEATNCEPPYITKFKKALKTIKPTSIDSESAFSTAGNFSTKKRTRFSDESLNSLVFLKHYF